MSVDRLAGLDPVIHVEARLRVTATLAALGHDDRITFPRLQQLLEMTGGNLSTHLRRLEDAGYVVIEKGYAKRTPVTWVALTTTGRTAFARYTTTLRSLLDPTPTGDTR